MQGNGPGLPEEDGVGQSKVQVTGAGLPEEDGVGHSKVQGDRGGAH